MQQLAEHLPPSARSLGGARLAARQELHCCRSVDVYFQRAALFFLLSLGAGVQGALRPRRRFLLGVEPSFDFTWPGVLILFRTRAFVGWRFG